MTRDYPAVHADRRIADIAGVLSAHRYAVVFQGDKYRGLLFPSDAIADVEAPAGSLCRDEVRCLDSDNIADTLDLFFQSGAFALPVFSAEKGTFMGVVLFGNLFASMRKAQLGFARVTVRQCVAPAEDADARNEFLSDLCGYLKEPLQRISSLANIIKREENDSSRIMLCYSIEAAVDQIDKSFEVLRKAGRVG
jgi:hypothetical protein